MRRTTLPLPLIAALTMLLAAPPLLLAGATPGTPVARALDAATRRAAERRAETVTRAIGAIESADPVDAALSLQDAIEQTGGDPALVGALEHLRPQASKATEARVDRMLREGKTREAVSLLARVSAALHSDRLDELLDRATLDLRLLEAAEFEAGGERIRAMEAVARAVQIAPNDPRVRTAAEVHGLRSTVAPISIVTTPASVRQPPPPVATQPANTSVDARLTALEGDLRRVLDSMASTPGVDTNAMRDQQRLDQLERDLRRQLGDIDRVTRVVEDMGSRQRLDGRAEFATDELDRRVRELERTISSLRREISSLNNDVRSLQRSVRRP